MTSSMDVDYIRTRVHIDKDSVFNTSSSAFPGNYHGYDDRWMLDTFKDNFRIDVISKTDSLFEFDIVGIDAAIANALRRILLSEVPTMAIEDVFIMKNTSIVPDEMLASRLGLIPIAVDPRAFEWRVAGSDPTDVDTIVFEMNVTCREAKGAREGMTDPKDKYENAVVYSNSLVFKPAGSQEETYADNPIMPVHDNIILAKLRPKQEISLVAHCCKGTGDIHAKWSPVSTASYRLLPEITLLRPIRGDDAILLESCFPKGVIAVENGADGVVEARVADARKCKMSREVFRHPQLEGAVRLSRVRDHFIFSVESTGALPAHVLVSEAIKVLREKCTTVINELDIVTDAQSS